MKRLNKEVQFIFTLSHVGILGNEKADRAVRAAANKNETDLGIPIRDKDVIVEIKKIYDD